MRDLSILLVHLGATLAQLTGPNATPADDEGRGGGHVNGFHIGSQSARALCLPKTSYARFA